MKKKQKTPAPAAARVHIRELRANLAALLRKEEPTLITRGNYELAALLIPLNFNTWSTDEKSATLARAKEQATKVLSQLDD